MNQRQRISLLIFISAILAMYGVVGDISPIPFALLIIIVASSGAAFIAE